MVCIPTLSYEHELIFGVPVKRAKSEKPGKSLAASKVDLRLKETRSRTQLLTLDDGNALEDADVGDDFDGGAHPRPRGRRTSGLRARHPVFVSMETVS